MNGAGITQINSGPLLIRILNSNNGTYIFTSSQYVEQPISSNYVLITSSNGLLTPSNQIYVSSITLPTFLGNTSNISYITRDMITCSTIYTSTHQITNISSISMNGQSLTTNNIILNTISTSTTHIIDGSISTISGLPNSILVSDKLEYTSSLLFSPLLPAYISTISTNTLNTYILYNQFNVSTNVLSTNVLSSLILSTSIYSTNKMIVSTFSSSNIVANNGIHNTINQRIINASTILTSTLSTTNVSFDRFLASTLTINVISNDLAYKTIFGSSINISTLYGSTSAISQLSIRNGNFSNMNGSSIISNNLNVSSISLLTLTGTTSISNTIAGSSIICSSSVGSTLLSNQLNVSSFYLSTIYGSTLSISLCDVSTISVSSLSCDMLYASTCNIANNNISTSIINVGYYSSIYTSSLFTNYYIISSGMYQTLIGSTLTTSTLLTPSMNISSYNGSSLISYNSNYLLINAQTATCNQLSYLYVYGSTLYISSMYINHLLYNSSTIYTNLLSISSITNDTYTFSTLILSSINGTRIGSGNITNTSIGNDSLRVNLLGSYNTAFGYQTLMNNINDSYQTAIGTNTLSLNTTGSYHTAIGSGAGILNGFSGSYTTYIGYSVIPSGSVVTNEVIIGGSNTAGGINPGNGNNSVTIGNTSIIKNILYGSVGIGTTYPMTTLDVRGSYQQIGGQMTIINSNNYAYLFIYSDTSANGCGIFLNTSANSADGGTYTATFRNDYGTLRLQSAGGYSNPTNGITILSNGNVGFNSNNPSNKLDIVGNVSVANTLQVNNLTILNQFTNNGQLFSYIDPWISGNGLYTLNRVGIGNSNPGSYALNITGSVYIDTQLTDPNYGDGRQTSVIAKNGLYCSNMLITDSINTGYTKCGNFIINSTLHLKSFVVNQALWATLYIENTCTVDSLIAVSTINGLALASIQDLSSRTLYGGRDAQGGIIVMDHDITIASDQRSSINIQQPYGVMLGNWEIWAEDNTYTTLLNYTYSKFWIGKQNNTLFSTYLDVQTGITTGWHTTSDIRLKTNIVPLSTIISSILLLNPVTYNMLHDSRMNMSMYVGFVAQEVQTLFPHSIDIHEDTTGISTLGITYDKLIPCLIKGFQEEHSTILCCTSSLTNTSTIISEPLINNISTIHNYLILHNERLSRLEQLVDIRLSTLNNI